MMQDDFDSSAATLTDRRRPGRLAEVSPHLLPLLRASERDSLPPLPELAEPAYPEDRLIGAGQGLVLASIAGGAVWAGAIRLLLG